MKKLRLKYIFQLVLLSLISYTSCTDNIDKNDDISEDNIKLSPYIYENSNVKATSTSFEQNDNIGVFAVPYVNSNATEGDLQSDKYATNIKVTYDGSLWNPQTALTWYSGTTKVTLYAYYPYDTSASTANVTDYSFANKSDQSLAADFKASDFLWAKSAGTAPTFNKVSLPFTHKMSKIRVNIKTQNGFANEDIVQSIKSIQNVYIDGTVNLSDGSVTTQASATLKNVTPYQYSNATDGYSATVEAIVLPQTISAGIDFISIKSNSTSTPFIYELPNDLTLEQGKLYTFNITVDRTGISIIATEIKDWETYPDIDGNINTVASKAFDISSLDWDKTRVYKVLDNGVQVAEVAKEYLLNSSIDAQAIVVYTMNSDGTVNKTSGLVAQVMSTTSNAQNEFDPDTGSIHGGTVTWNVTSNAITTYNAGTSNLIQKIQLKDGVLSAADLKAIYVLTVEPALVTDIDNNTYGIVKIGTQYWMRENLKVEHYQDGSSAEYYYYNDNSSFKDIYGGLYPWSTVMNSKGLAPAGWYIPSNDEFTSLKNYLGSNSGAKLKAASSLWSSISTSPSNTNNKSGFSGLPGGRRRDSDYNESNNYGQWWSTTEYNSGNARRIYLAYGTYNDVYFTTLSKSYSLSIRCLRN